MLGMCIKLDLSWLVESFHISVSISQLHKLCTTLSGKLIRFFCLWPCHQVCFLLTQK